MRAPDTFPGGHPFCIAVLPRIEHSHALWVPEGRTGSAFYPQQSGGMEPSILP